MPLELERLIGDLAWAKANRLPPRELVPLLRKLVAVAPEGSSERRQARCELAEHLVASAPWRAARLAREVLEQEDDARAWGVLGIAHSLLGNYRSSLTAYRRALFADPGCPEYEHNLGHLLDVAFGRPRSALPHLRRAHAALPREPEIASSLAHALLGAGRTDDARSVLVAAFDGDLERASATLERWVAAGP